MNSVLDLKRLSYFVKRQLYLNISSLWIGIAAIVGTLLVISALFAYFEPDSLPGLRNLYLVVFLVGGYIFTSKIFDEMNTPQKSYSFLTLPVSQLEKLLGAWAITSPVYIVIFALFMLLLLFFSSIVARQPDALPYLLDKDVLKCIKVYLVTQTVFFLGACSFRGNNFLKTLLTLFVFVLLISVYSGGVGAMLFADEIAHMEKMPYMKADSKASLKNTFEYIFGKVIPFIFWYLLGPFLLLVSYFKLKERQV